MSVRYWETRTAVQGPISDFSASAIMPVMPITFAFAFRVRDLHARGMTVELIAQRANASVDDVLEAHRVINLPVNDADEPVVHRTDTEQREAEREKMPLRIQKRIADAKRH